MHLRPPGYYRFQQSLLSLLLFCVRTWEQPDSVLIRPPAGSVSRGNTNADLLLPVSRTSVICGWGWCCNRLIQTWIVCMTLTLSLPNALALNPPPLAGTGQWDDALRVTAFPYKTKICRPVCCGFCFIKHWKVVYRTRLFV